jgi:aspartokinase-like uncharacterized kinase
LVSTFGEWHIDVWVVKIGGSLADNTRLIEWLKILSSSKQAIVLVPGGGPFADQVRSIQSHWQFSDTTAHHMAILAMQQYGLMLAGLNPQFKCAISAQEVKKNLSAGLLSIIWMPSIDELQEDGVAASWDVSSDSLAVWLCSKLDAERLILIKSTDMSQHKDDSIKALQLANIVDQAFLQMMDHVNCPLTVLGSDQLDDFRRIEV